MIQPHAAQSPIGCLKPLDVKAAICDVLHKMLVVIVHADYFLGMQMVTAGCDGRCADACLLCNKDWKQLTEMDARLLR